MLHNPAAIAAVSAVVVASLAGGTYVAVTHNPFGKSGSEVVKPRPEPKPEQGPSGAAMPQPTREPGPHTTPVVNPGPRPMPQPNADPPPSPPPVVNPTPAMTPLTRVKFRVRLASKISSEASEEGQPVRGMVLAPGSYGACSMDGVVTKAGHSGFIPGRRRAELLFTFYTLHCPNGTRGIDSHVVSFWNSRGQANVDEEGQKVESSNGAKKIVLATAGGAVIGAITGHSKSTTAKGAAARAGVGVALTSLSGKGKVLSFAPGSVFVVQVSERRDH
jgi:hypothetical protein